MKTRISIGETHSIRKGGEDEVKVYHYVEFYRQPAVRLTIWRVYHFWDMHFKWFHKLCNYIDEQYDEWSHRKTGRENCKHLGDSKAYRRTSNGKMEKIEVRPFCLRLPWFARQDCRCYELSIKGRVNLGQVYLDYIPQARRAENKKDNQATKYSVRSVAGPPPTDDKRKPSALGWPEGKEKDD